MSFAIEKLEPAAAALRRAGFEHVTTEAIHKAGVSQVRIAGSHGESLYEYTMVVDGMSDDQVVACVHNATAATIARLS